MHRSLAASRRPMIHSLLGLALMAALGLSAPAVSASAGAEPAGSTECVPADTSSARTTHGSGHGRDYNTVTAAQAKSMQSALQGRVKRLIAAGKLTAGGRPAKGERFTVRTYVHVITREDGTGGVSMKQVRDQIDVINAGYAGTTADEAAATPFRFVLAGVDTTADDAWYDWNLTEDFSDEDAEAKEAKRALRVGGWADLNVYIAGLGSGLLGYATFPGGELALDGLVLLNESLPGGSAAPYNLGDTATHEIGHWLGLFHTFQGGCKGAGDHVPDTPAQADGDNIFFCNESDDTCTKPGLDPVHNFMSYGDDFCLDRFTALQSLRQVHTWLGMRVNR